MTRNNSVNFTGPLQYPIADAATDLFKKEDVQVATKALDLHDHTAGKGLPIPAGAIPNGTITSAMIADGTIDTVDLKDGSVTSAKIADGTIATADHAAASITNALLASDTARANLLTNGGFEIWQRGNGPFTASGVYTADKWGTGLVGTDTFSISRDSANADTATAGQYCAAVTFTLGTGAGGSNFYQYATVSDGPTLRGRTVSFSIRVKTSTANAVRIAGHDGSAWSYGSSHPGDGTWRTLTYTFTIGASATNWYYGVSFTASATIYLDNAMLVVGSQAADYAPLHPADDVARCLRYYEQKTAAAGWGLAMAHATSTTTAAWYWPFKAVKAVTPTITYQGATNYGAINSGGAVVQATGIGTYTVNVDQLYAHVDVASGLAAGNASQLSSSTSFGGMLVAEANP